MGWSISQLDQLDMLDVEAISWSNFSFHGTKCTLQMIMTSHKNILLFGFVYVVKLESKNKLIFSKNEFPFRLYGWYHLSIGEQSLVVILGLLCFVVVLLSTMLPWNPKFRHTCMEVHHTLEYKCSYYKPHSIMHSPSKGQIRFMTWKIYCVDFLYFMWTQCCCADNAIPVKKLIIYWIRLGTIMLCRHGCFYLIKLDNESLYALTNASKFTKS